jgi:hypothetical protein
VYVSLLSSLKFESLEGQWGIKNIYTNICKIYKNICKKIKNVKESKVDQKTIKDE